MCEHTTSVDLAGYDYHDSKALAGTLKFLRYTINQWNGWFLRKASVECLMLNKKIALLLDSPGSVFFFTAFPSTWTAKTSLMIVFLIFPISYTIFHLL